MSFGRLNFDQIVESVLLELIYAGVPEGVSIDCKVGICGRTDADLKEFLKDAPGPPASTDQATVMASNETVVFKSQ